MCSVLRLIYYLGIEFALGIVVKAMNRKGSRKTSKSRGLNQANSVIEIENPDEGA